MARHITPIAHEIVKISEDGNLHLGVRIASASQSRATKQFADSAKSDGWIVRDDAVEAWHPQGFVEQDGQIYLYGPYLSGRSVQEILGHSAKGGIAYVYRLAKAMNRLADNSVPLSQFQSNSVIFLDDGGELFLPPRIMERMRSTQVEADRIDTYELYNHPDLPEEEALSFSLGVLTYRVLTGEMPYAADSDEEIHQQMRDLEILSPQMRNPDISEKASSAVMNALKKTKADSPTLDEWEKTLAEWVESGFTEKVSLENRREIEESAIRLGKRATSAYRRKTYLRRNWRSLAMVGVAVVVVGSIGGSILRNALRPRVTLGKTPIEVVEIFYNGITDLDHEAVEDCVTGDAGKGEVTEATNLFVISRMRLGQEGTTGLYPAQAWKDAGMPEMKEGYFVYGISDLKITEESPTVFLAEYEKWEQATEETALSVGRRVTYVGFRRTDRLHFVELDEKYWAIYQIDRLVDEIIIPEN